MLQRLHHKQPARPVHDPHKWISVVHGKRRQHGTPDDTSDRLDPKKIRELQSIVGSLFYYTRAVDPSLLPALNEISTQQAQPIKFIWSKGEMLLDYVHTHQNAQIRHHASDMCLHVDSDASYLTLPRARSRLAGHFFLSDRPITHHSIKPNGPVLAECKTIRHVVVSSAEAETSALFHNAQTAIPIRHLLRHLDHPQPPTPLKMENATANSFVHQNMRHKK